MTLPPPLAANRGTAMNHTDLHQRLLERLRAAGRKAVAFGIDLGTTKSCVAYAAFDPDTGALQCDCIRYRRPDGSMLASVPSVVALEHGRVLFGAEALSRRGQKGFLPERALFSESKNEIGLRYSYARAPEGFGNAGEVATRLLEHLRTGVVDTFGQDIGSPLVVTVPASFHGAQRSATVDAAETAFELEPHSGAIRLLDEPYAAFLDLLWRAPSTADKALAEGANVLVFDFGGGTCDVAIFRRDAARGGTLGARLLGTSRYHRLGGGDIDRAIVHDVLIPALLAENGLQAWDVSWLDKRRQIEPMLLDAAERLKLELSRKLASQAGDAVVDAVDATLEPLAFDAEIAGVVRRLTLSAPMLDAAGFERLLEPFLDPEPPAEAGDEYVQRNSIFSPIVHALMRAGLEAEDIDGVLLCGSSALLPQVKRELARKFPNAAFVRRGDGEDLEGTVARGAALQAMALQVLEQPLIAPVCSAEISLRVATGKVPLARAGDAVPAASDAPLLLRPPRDAVKTGADIAVEAVTEGERTIGRSLWRLPAPVSVDDRLALDWRMDENQCLELTLTRMDDPDTPPFVHRFDAPIAHRDSGQVTRVRMLERMEAIRQGNVTRADLGAAFEQIARDSATLGEHEKALHFIALALQEKGDDINLLNLRGICREKIGDRDGARASYRLAEDWAGARFNLALMDWRAGNYDEALKEVDSALDDEPKRAYRVLRGDILAKLGRKDEAHLEWQDAISGKPDWSKFSDFDLGWLDRAAQALEEKSVLKRIRKAREKAAQGANVVTRQGELPEFVSRPLEDPAGMV